MIQGLLSQSNLSNCIYGLLQVLIIMYNLMAWPKSYWVTALTNDQSVECM